MTGRNAILALVFVAASACSEQKIAPKIAGAGASSAIALALAAANRATTGECWSYCRLGTVCDKASGLCVEASSYMPPAQHSAPPVQQERAAPEAHEYEIPPLPSNAPGASVP
ncbi:Hypothetical protein A7982_04315 [Minicystis rosea]|nr:Hypothetical protein A7982_04315 [Minicystis rosea]